MPFTPHTLQKPRSRSDHFCFRVRGLPNNPLRLFVPAEQMPDVLAVVGDWPPMTWAVDVVAEVTTVAEFSTDGWLGIAGLGALVALALSVASLSMTRKTA